MANKCKECGCSCKRCINSDHDVQLHVEIENLKQRLLEKENHIVMMETHFLNEANKFPNGELVAVREELLTWQDKYRRLYEAHRRVQRVNQGLEDKLLKLVDVCETEKTTLTKDVATLSHKLAEANYAIKKLTEDNERYKNDVGLAIQFLQCKQSNFVAHKFDSLTPEVQLRVSNYMTPKKKSEDRMAVSSEVKSIKVPMPTFPPTAMVYSVPKSPNPERKADTDVESAASTSADVVSAAVVAKVLEERQRERALAKHCDTCTCSKNLKIVYDNTHHTVGTQTGDYKEMSCLRCNDGLQVAVSGMKIVRSNELKMQTVVPIYPLENLEPVPFAQSTNNIVKVQPNNFLADNKSQTGSRNSSPVDLSSQTSSKNHSVYINSRVISNEDGDDNLRHHRLCDKSLSNYEFGVTIEKGDSEKNVDMTSAKNNSIDNPKGPRYCSMRVQSGSRNILLDNAHNNIAPVLYTRTHRRHDDTAQTHDSTNTTVSDSDHRFNSMASETSAQNQQRVAEWIQSTLETEVSSPEHSRSESSRNRKLDKVKYAEMEENVKRFLFGESEFQKTVEIGKKKYENFRDGSGEATAEAKEGGSMETNI